MCLSLDERTNSASGKTHYMHGRVQLNENRKMSTASDDHTGEDPGSSPSRPLPEGTREQRFYLPSLFSALGLQEKLGTRYRSEMVKFHAVLREMERVGEIAHRRSGYWKFDDTERGVVLEKMKKMYID
eukprot:g13518.t1